MASLGNSLKNLFNQNIAKTCSIRNFFILKPSAFIKECIIYNLLWFSTCFIRTYISKWNIIVRINLPVVGGVLRLLPEKLQLGRVIPFTSPGGEHTGCTCSTSNNWTWQRQLLKQQDNRARRKALLGEHLTNSCGAVGIAGNLYLTRWQIHRLYQ